MPETTLYIVPTTSVVVNNLDEHVDGVFSILRLMGYGVEYTPSKSGGIEVNISSPRGDDFITFVVLEPNAKFYPIIIEPAVVFNIHEYILWMRIVSQNFHCLWHKASKEAQNFAQALVPGT